MAGALTLDQKAFYSEQGYLVLPGFIGEAWLGRLDAAMNRFIAESRTLTRSSKSILVEPGHTPTAPRLRRIPQTGAFDPDFEEFGLNGPVVDIAEDLLGPHVRLHHSKLNFKWSDGGEVIDWHQDIQFWPHSNYSLITIGVYLCDVDHAMGPMGVYAGSHRHALSTLRDEAGNWTGALSDAELARLDPAKIGWCSGPRGTVTVHHCRAVHGSPPNHSPRMRPLLLHTYATGDAQPLTNLMEGIPFANIMVRGTEKPARTDDEPCPMPPDFRESGYTSIFASQGKVNI
jgi:ectoine hydroxylase-related dioxygenase (phytanoyl-CoA dioxygenase family)